SVAIDERLLILETSGRVGIVALAEGDRLRASRRLDEARRHARDLAPTVADLLAAAGAGWKPRDLHAVVVGRGPGSYTGLRVGNIPAKTIAYATGCAIIALDTFPFLAAQALDPPRQGVGGGAEGGRKSNTLSAKGRPSPQHTLGGEAEGVQELTSVDVL